MKIARRQRRRTDWQRNMIDGGQSYSGDWRSCIAGTKEDGKIRRRCGRILSAVVVVVLCSDEGNCGY